MHKKSFSWGLISLLLFVFFPIAIYMIIKKMSVEKLSYINNGKALKNLGIVLLCFGGIYLIMAITDGMPKTEDSSIVSGMITCIIIFGACGLLCVFKGIEYIKRGKKYSRYVLIINTINDLTIDNIASAFPTTYKKTVLDIQAMLNEGFFMNAYLDLNNRKLIRPRILADSETNDYDSSISNAICNKPYSYKCSNCGANNMIISGMKNECEYCGSPIQ